MKFKSIITLLLLLLISRTYSQELYINTEPASLIPKGTKVIRLNHHTIFLNDISGQIFALFILTVAAAEAAIGLAIIVVYYRNTGTIHVEEIDSLKG